MRRGLFFLSVLIGLLVVLPARAELSRPVYERRLANGLRVIVCPDPAATDVSLLVHYDTGSRDEPTGLEGLAHLVEHLMFQGSKHVPRGKLAELLEQAGATNVNGATTIDATVYHETLPPERLELGLWLESDRMGYLLDSIDGITFASALSEVQNEYRDRVTEVPLGRVRAIELGELFPGWHPYNHIPAGTRDSLAGITLADARAFAATWYGPANAVVVVAGNVEAPAAAALAERYFGSLPARPPPPRPALPALTRSAATVAYVAAAVKLAEARVAWVTPAYGTREDAALDVAAAILAGRGAGWLNQVLMGEPRLCTSVSVTEDSNTLASVFEIGATVAEGHSLNEVLRAIQGALARFDTSVTDEEAERGKRIWYNAHLFGLSSTLAWAERLALDARWGPLPAWFDGRLGHHASVRTAEVRSVVRTWLAQRPPVVVLSYPRSGAPLSGVVTQWKEMRP